MVAGCKLLACIKRHPMLAVFGTARTSPSPAVLLRFLQGADGAALAARQPKECRHTSTCPDS